ncbi:MAG: single-stranded-DNA-specific exonuclease RecJ [Bacteroidota bacterium]
MIWKFEQRPAAETVAPLVKDLSTSKAFPQVLAELLLRRGIDDYEAAKAYFAPQASELHDPHLMKNLPQAVERLIQAFRAGEKILLYGDYDVDGTTSVSLMSLFFEAIELPHEVYIPDRYTEGYGLSYQGVDYAESIGANLMITLDCGIKAVDKVRYAATKGIEVIICDHHTPGSELPPALAILDPKQSDCPYPYKELTGCGVGFKLIQAFSAALNASNLYQAPDPLAEYADLLALSIACDIVPITGENRTLAHFGLAKIRNKPLPGIGVLKSQAQSDRHWDISDLVFFIGPRINSAGRLNHGKDAVKVLRGKSQDLIQLAHELQSANDERKTLDRETTEEALAQIANSPEPEAAFSTVLYEPHWHKGIIGIVASRLIETYYRPTVLLTQNDGKLVGSARSVKGFDLYEALDLCKEHLIQFGGHKYAAGLTMKPEAFPAFAAHFETVVAERLTEDQRQPTLAIDAPLSFLDIDARLIRLIQRMEPFGPANRKPVFATPNVRVLNSVILKEVHVKLVVESDKRMFEAIGFNLAEKWHRLASNHVHIAYQPDFNTWNGKTKINLRLKDLKHPNEAILFPD